MLQAAQRAEPAAINSFPRHVEADELADVLVEVLADADVPPACHPQRAPDHAVWGEVACLLSRKRDAIHPLHALSLLPGEVSGAPHCCL